MDGTLEVLFAPSGAASNWWSEKVGEPMRVSDFPGPGYGAQGWVPQANVTVVVVFLDSAKVTPGMPGITAPGLAAFNARTPYLTCNALWRNETETERLVPVRKGHDMIVDPCHLGTFDPYDSAKEVFGSVPVPLDQLSVRLVDGTLWIHFNNYRFGGHTPQV